MQRVGLWRWVRNAATKHTEALQYQAYLDSLLRNLSDHPQVIGHESLLQDNINKLYKEALQRHAKLIVDDRARTHLQVACLVEGSYKTLLPWFRNDQDKVIELIRKPLGESAAGVLGIFQKMALFLSFDKFSFMSRSLNYLDSDFGKAFSIDHHINLRLKSLAQLLSHAADKRLKHREEIRVAIFLVKCQDYHCYQFFPGLGEQHEHEPKRHQKGRSNVAWFVERNTVGSLSCNSTRRMKNMSAANE